MSNHHDDLTHRLQKDEDNNKSFENENNDEHFELKKKIGVAGSVALIAGTMVGSGIFVSPVGVLAGTNGSVGMSLVMWAACGVVAGLAALCYCELASMFRDSGGEYAYLYRGYGRFGSVLSFTFAWTSIFIVRVTSNAATAVAFGAYTVAPFFPGNCPTPNVIVKSAAAISLLGLTLLNYVDVKAASKFQSVLAVAKFIGMGIIIFGGFVRIGMGDKIGLNNFQNSFKPEDLADLGFTQIGLAFYQGLWSYEGWNNLNYVSEEVKDSKKTVPLAIIITVPLVTVFYILVNIAYFAVLTPEEILTSDTVAVTWGYRVLGIEAGWIMPVVVCLSTLGALNGSMLTGGRLPFVAARRGHMPQILAMATVDYYTPGPALILTLIFLLVFVIPNDFDTLVNAFSFSAWLFYAMVIASVLILRITHPDLARPFKVPIIIPVMALIIAVYLVIAPFVDNPDIIVLFAAAFMLCGPIVYFVLVYKNIKIPGVATATLWLQKLLDVAPTDWKDFI